LVPQGCVFRPNGGLWLRIVHAVDSHPAGKLACTDEYGGGL